MNDTPFVPRIPAPPSNVQDPVKPPGNKEIATLFVKGQEFTDWTSVRVEQQAAQWYPIFQFESTEDSPVPVKYADLRFRPGDGCDVFLGGQQVVKGYINERHVAYDGKQHAIRLIGRGDGFDLESTSVPPEKLEGHDGKNVLQLAKDLGAHLNVGVQSINADPEPFDKIGVQPGETISTVIERFARNRNIVIGSNPLGGILLIGEHEEAMSGQLVEGHNILRANAVIRDTHLFNRIYAYSSESGGSSGTGGAAADQQYAQEQGTMTSRDRCIIAVCEVADKPHGVARRAKMERVFTEGSEIEANITVQGWFKNGSNRLWRATEHYYINSPSLILDGVVLACASCTYEQSDSGTTTTLKMVKPEHLNGLMNYRDAARELIFGIPKLGGIGGRVTE